MLSPIRHPEQNTTPDFMLYQIGEVFNSIFTVLISLYGYTTMHSLILP